MTKESAIGEALGFDPNEAINENNLTRDELIEFARASLASLKNAYMDSRIDADEHELALGEFLDMRSNGDTYITKKELASMTQLFDSMARQYDKQKSRVDSLEQHRDFNTERVDDLEKENERLRSKINELENRSLLDYLW